MPILFKKKATRTGTKQRTLRTKSGSPLASARRRRFPPAERERMILEGAIRFFAEEGFHGQTRALADRLGVTHSVLYRYFPSKEALIDRVYKELYLRRWNPDWIEVISDRLRPFPVRLSDFYVSYAEAIFDPNWVRIFMFSGLRNVGLTKKYYRHVRKNIVIPLCAELRAHAKLPTFESIPLQEHEEELFWSLHGGIFFMAIRKFVYGVEVPAAIDTVVRTIVSQFLLGAVDSVTSILASASNARSERSSTTVAFDLLP